MEGTGGERRRNVGTIIERKRENIISSNFNCFYLSTLFSLHTAVK